MHHRQDPPDDVLRTAVAQGGVISAEQVVLLGYSLRCADRLVNQRSWNRLARGIYHLGAGEPTWVGQAWAGVLMGGTVARLGFRAAGFLWGFVDEPPASISVLVPHGRLHRHPGPWTFQQERPGVRLSRSPGSPPRTTVEDTVLDLCSLARPRDLAGLLSRAVQSRRTTAPRIEERLGDRARMPHRQLLQQMLQDVGDGAESALELRYLRDVQRPHHLPPARRQARGRRGREFRDMRYEAFGTIVELDGRLHILGRFRDMDRDNATLLEGDLTLRYGWPDITERPCQVARQVAALLIARGWTEVPTRCTRCAGATDRDLHDF